MVEQAGSTMHVEAADLETPTAEGKKIHTMLDSNFPVLVPYTPTLAVSNGEFAKVIAELQPQKRDEKMDPETAPTATVSTIGQPKDTEPKSGSKLIDALMHNAALNMNQDMLAVERKTLTANADLAHASPGHPLVDLFYELKDGATKIEEGLHKAWGVSPEDTLKIIFNARSIHLGKGEKHTTYQALGWLYQYHPQTLLANLIWLARPVIEKKVASKKVDNVPGRPGSQQDKTDVEGANKDDDFEMIDDDDTNATAGDANDSMSFVLPTADVPMGAIDTQNDVKYGVAHGYWKDLVNMLLLAVNDQFKVKGDVRSVLNFDGRTKPERKRNFDQIKAKELREQKRSERRQRFEQKFVGDERYRALHLTIARIFGSQLRSDIAALKSGKGKRDISLAAKWAPSPFESHDKQTFIVSSIAEVLFSPADVGLGSTPDRATYLKLARKAYRDQILSPLRKQLAVVERDLSANKLSQIKYERVPSLAMNRYAGTFLKKDEGRFMKYLENVSAGKANISGAVLLPSTLVAKAYRHSAPGQKKVANITTMADSMLLDGQWRTLVQRIKDSGKLESAIAVCDVSGSMSYPCFQDKTCPMDSAIGLSLLLAEIVEPPFGGCFISFSEEPVVQKVGGPSDTRTFKDKVAYIKTTDWGMTTDFVAVFEKLILPLAVNNRLKQEDMVKKVFVFSDMQFNQAQNGQERWTTSYERIKKRFEDAGYKMPEMVFWNLAYGTQGAPVEADEEGVSLVSGYSQGMLKMFLDGGQFEDEIDVEVVDEDVGDDEVDVQVTKKVKKDPLAAVKKALSHPAYAMLKVVD